MKVFIGFLAIVTTVVFCNASLLNGVSSETGFSTVNGNIGWKSVGDGLGHGSNLGRSNPWTTLGSGFGSSGSYGSSNRGETNIWKPLKSDFGSKGSNFGDNNAWKSAGNRHDAKSYIKIFKTISPSTPVTVPGNEHKATPLSNVGTGIVHGASNSEWPSVGSGIVGGFGQYGEGSSWKSEATHGTGLGGIASKATSYVNIVSYNKAAAPGTGSNIWSGLNYGGRSYGRSNEWKSDEGSSSGWW